mmetsp:Transcript_102699/g.188057  ORF Transcript_102699/g.188057 Transcript_102699/m.188057 type:complete len:126 (-) Transcript_102699:251-628(-)
MKLETWKKEGTLDKVKELTKYAKDKLQCSLSQLALAWSVRNGNVTTTILGATKPEQLQENLGCIPVARRMTAADDAAVEKILANAPEAYTGWGGNGFRPLERIESAEAPVRVMNFMLPPARTAKL